MTRFTKVVFAKVDSGAAYHELKKTNFDTEAEANHDTAMFFYNKWEAVQFANQLNMAGIEAEAISYQRTAF